MSAFATMKRRRKLERVADGEKVIDDDLLVHDADQAAGDQVVLLIVVAEDGDRAAPELHDPADHVDRRALARAVGSEEAEDLAGADFEAQILDDRLPGERFTEITET
jgi:hypothetical protein